LDHGLCGAEAEAGNIPQTCSGDCDRNAKTDRGEHTDVRPQAFSASAGLWFGTTKRRPLELRLAAL
jgi:hypothetical protein